MRRFLVLFLLLSSSCLAQEPLPSLGDCSPYTDYYIYKCQAFKCKLPVARLIRTTLEMEVVGIENNLCNYNYKYIIRNPAIPPAEIKMKCALSENGKLEMANQFTNEPLAKLQLC